MTALKKLTIYNFFTDLIFHPEHAKPKYQKQSLYTTVAITVLSLGIVPICVGACWGAYKIAHLAAKACPFKIKKILKFTPFKTSKNSHKKPVKVDPKDERSIPDMPSVSKPNPLNFDGISLKEGLSTEKLDSTEREVLSNLAAQWKTRDLSKEEWSISELSDFLKQDKKILQKLFNSIALKPNAQQQYPKLGIDKLFQVLETNLSGAPSSTHLPGVKMLWNGRIPLAVTLFGMGSDKEYWKIDELEMFLAVDRKALIDFLGVSKDQYSFKEVDDALKYGQNSQINGLLEDNRTQINSLRWALLVES